MTRTPAPTRRKPFSLTGVDEQVLRAAYELHYLTVDQLCRLRYSPGSITYVRDRLKRLADAGYLKRCWPARMSGAGRTPTAYVLTGKGMAYCQAQGLEAPARYRPPDGAMIADPVMAHTLTVNDVLIAVRLLEREVPSIRVVALEHERWLKRRAAVVPTGTERNGQQESVYVVPDGWVDLRLVRTDGNQEMLPLWIEIDRDTERVQKFKAKVRGLLAYTNQQTGHYKDTFGTPYVTFCIVVDAARHANAAATGRRVRELVRWIEEELDVRNRRDYAPNFYVTTLPRDIASGTRLFCAPRWYQPFGDRPVPLLEVSADSTPSPEGGFLRAPSGVDNSADCW